RFVGQLAERDLITIAPPVFVCFATWLGRGMRRPQPATAIAALAVVVTALLWPVSKLVTTFAVPDAFTTIPLYELLGHTSAHTLPLAWFAGATIAAALAVFTPRRLAPVLALLVVAALAATSALAQAKIDGRAKADRTEFFGTSSTRWLDAAAAGPVAYLDEDP